MAYPLDHGYRGGSYGEPSLSLPPPPSPCKELPHWAGSHAEGKLAQLAKPKLLIMDEFGYLPFEPAAAHLLFQLVSRRYERGSILIMSNRAAGD